MSNANYKDNKGENKRQLHYFLLANFRGYYQLNNKFLVRVGSGFSRISSGRIFIFVILSIK